MLLPMEAHFRYWIKNEKSNCDFYLEIEIYFSYNCIIQTRNYYFFLRIVSYKLAIAS